MSKDEKDLQAASAFAQSADRRGSGRHVFMAFTINSQEVIDLGQNRGRGIYIDSRKVFDEAIGHKKTSDSVHVGGVSFHGSRIVNHDKPYLGFLSMQEKSGPEQATADTPGVPVHAMIIISGKLNTREEETLSSMLDQMKQGMGTYAQRTYDIMRINPNGSNETAMDQSLLRFSEEHPERVSLHYAETKDMAVISLQLALGDRLYKTRYTAPAPVMPTTSEPAARPAKRSDSVIPPSG